MKKKDPNRYPKGWTAKRVRGAIASLDGLSDAEWAEADEAARRAGLSEREKTSRLVATLLSELVAAGTLDPAPLRKALAAGRPRRGQRVA